jgi:hypothetical protein
MASPMAPAVARSDSLMDGSTGAMMRRSTETRKARRKSRVSAFIQARSSVEQVRPARPREGSQISAPGGLHPR